MKPITKGYLLAALSATGFGVGPIIAKIAYNDGASVSFVLFSRFFLGALLLWVYIWWKRMEIPKQRSIYFSTAFLGMVLYSSMSWCYFSSVQTIPSSLAALILYMFPLFVMIGSVLFFKENLTFKSVFSLALSIFGIILVLGNEFKILNPVGLTYAAAAAIIYSIYILIGKITVNKHSPIIITALVSTFASLPYLIVLLFSAPAPSITWVSWASVVLFAVSTLLIAVLSFFMSMKLIGPTRASIVSTLEPLVTIIFSAWIYQERLNLWQSIGGGLILLSIFLLIYKTKGEKTMEKDAEQQAMLQSVNQPNMVT